MLMALNLIRKYAGLHVLLIIFICLAILYNLSLPLFEAPDEKAHFNVVNWMADFRGLPNVDNDLVHIGHEVAQPPLYYFLLGLIVSPINRSDIDSTSPYNPNWEKGDGINLHYHTMSERFPYRSTSLAVHMARFASTIMALVTIVSTYFLANLIMPKLAIIAAAIVAFNPQFIFISSAVTNDTLVTAISTLTLAVLVWLVIRPRIEFWPYVLLGLLWGLATLSKLSGLALGLIIAVGIIIITLRTRSWQLFIKCATGAVLGIVLIAGWWFLRNWLLYGNLLALKELLDANYLMVREEGLGWSETLKYAQGLRQSYWAAFGHGFVGPSWLYQVINVVLLISLVGLAIWLIRKVHDKDDRSRLIAVLLLILWTALVTLMLFRWMSQVLFSNQGRLLYPAIGSLAVLIALGLSTISGKRNWFTIIFVSFLGFWAAASPLIFIQPAYQKPSALASDVIIPNPMSVSFGDKMELLGFELSDSSIGIGHHQEVDLFWQAKEAMKESYVVVLTVVDASGQAVAKAETVPYAGRYQTPTWVLGEPFRDRYILQTIKADARVGLSNLFLSVYPYGQPGEPIPITVNGTQVGNAILLTSTKIKSDQIVNYTPEYGMDVRFGGVARLFGYDAPKNIMIGEPFVMTLYWEALDPDGKDYTVFVHFLDENGALVSQGDSPPQDNWYPTSIWEKGEQILDSHTLQAGDFSGIHHVVVGLYELESGLRLPALDEEGNPWLHDAVSLATIRVTTAED